MTTRRAQCSCGQLSLVAEGEPVRISICHCHACQRRSGSVFATQARFPAEQVGAIAGRRSTYVRVNDSGGRATFSFCTDCGGTLFWEIDAVPGIYVPVGAFADASFPPPNISVFENRMHPWVMRIADLDMEHD